MKPTPKSGGSKPKPRFTVDTHIFRELGQYLVGRDSTALAELVKNTYDADATEVSVYGEALDDPDRGMIRIVDNGNGMTAEEFSAGFLRIAGRLKEVSDRRSPRLQRRFTGAKGIGRLAAQKLAGLMEIESVPYRVPRGATRTTLVASIDWDRIEDYETLEEIEGATDSPEPEFHNGEDKALTEARQDEEGAEEESPALSVVERPVSQKSTAGTTITLRKLRQKWSDEVLREFVTELDTFRPPTLLTEMLPASVVDAKVLFAKPTIADADNEEGYQLTFEGDFAQGENLYPAAAHAALWVLEIDASPIGIRYGVAPTSRTLEKTPFAKRQDFKTPHPAPKDGPYFQARILLRGRASSKKETAFYSGVRIYMEGFRVLPYGDLTDDWLRLKQAVTDRTRKLDLGDGLSVPEQPDEGLFLLPPKHYAGGVFLTQKRSGDLQMVINREGFVASTPFTNLERMVRRGIDLMTRVRAQVDAEEERRKDKAKRGPPEGEEPTDVDAAYRRNMVEESLTHLHRASTDLRTLATRIPKGDAELVLRLAGDVEEAERVSRAYISGHAFVRVLASVGLQLAAFVHELNALLGMSTTLERAVGRLRDKGELEATVRTELARVHAGVIDLRRTLERQASYLVDVATPDARRRRTKQPIAERVAAAERLVRMSAERKGITIENDVPSEVKTPAMFSSELIAVFSNLLTNAVKAAGEGGHVRAAASVRSDGTVRFRLENTGAAVDLSESERWFRPFESTTTDVDPVLGQGMGLGLAITRDILDEYRAKIRFVAPTAKYATAIEITFPAP